MSDLVIQKMDFRQLRNEVQYLRDELAMMKRHYEDLLYNLDDDNISSISADKIKGLVVDSVTTDSLYAEYGDIADLTVDRISTAKRVKKYLSRDTSEDTFFEGYDQGIYFVQGVVVYDNYTEDGQIAEGANPIVEQLTNRHGMPLYWNGVIDYIAAGAAYDSEGNRLLITDKPSSGEPVTVYKYRKNVKLKLEFWTDTKIGYANPRITLGIGTDPTGASDKGKAVIEKTADELFIKYMHSDGVGVTGITIDGTTDEASGRVEGKGRLIGDWDGVGGDTINNTYETTYTPPSAICFYSNGFSVTYETVEGTSVETWRFSEDGSEIVNPATGHSILISEESGALI